MFSMSLLSQRTARLVVVGAVTALLVAACSPDSSQLSNGPTSPTLKTSRAAVPGGSSVTALGTASSFALLGGPSVSCTGSTIPVNVIGDVGAGLLGGVWVPVLCTVVAPGTVHQGDAIAAAAYNDFVLAWIALGNTPCSTDPTHHLSSTPGTMTLFPGVYCTDAAATLAGNLTLDAQGDPNAVWIFKIGTTAVGALTGTDISVNLINGAQACNVFWRVDAGVTMTRANFVGTILAGAAITFTGLSSAPGTFIGRAWAKAAVTITDMNVNNSCGAGPGPGPGPCKISRDRVTGGGFIWLASGAKGGKSHPDEKGTFGVSGGTKDGGFWGHLEYNDHRLNGPTVHGTGVTGYVALDLTTRHIDGTANYNGVAGYTYRVVVSDNGEPGRNDTFAIRVFNASGTLVYNASGTVEGGNIQLHKPHAGECDKDGHDRDGHDKDGHDQDDQDQNGQDQNGHDKDGRN